MTTKASVKRPDPLPRKADEAVAGASVFSFIKNIIPRCFENPQGGLCRFPGPRRGPQEIQPQQPAEVASPGTNFSEPILEWFRRKWNTSGFRRLQRGGTIVDPRFALAFFSLTHIVSVDIISDTMKTLRYIVCPCCDQSMSPKALDQRAYGRFRVDIRACGGRKGFPHIATDELNHGERVQIRSRLLGTIQAAVNEGLLTSEDLVVLTGPRTERYQMALPMAVGESTRAQAGESIRARVREDK